MDWMCRTVQSSAARGTASDCEFWSTWSRVQAAVEPAVSATGGHPRRAAGAGRSIPHTCTGECGRPFDPVRGRRGVSGRCRRVPAPLPGGHRSGVRQLPRSVPGCRFLPRSTSRFSIQSATGAGSGPWGPPPAPWGSVGVRRVVQAVVATRVDAPAAERARGSPPARCGACRRRRLRRLHAGRPGSKRRARDSSSSTLSRRSCWAGGDDGQASPPARAFRRLLARNPSRTLISDARSSSLNSARSPSRCPSTPS